MRSAAPLVFACALLGACSGDEKNSESEELDASVNASHEGESAWPSYGHDGKNTRYNAGEHILSKDNVKGLVKKWDSAKTGVNKYGVTSTPAVYDGVVYFGDWGGRLHAVDAKDGKKVWSTQLSKEKVGLNAQINASPFVTEERVFIGGADNQAFAVERKTGKKVWDPYVKVGKQKQVILWSSPNVVDDTLLIGVGSFQVFMGAPYTFRGNVVGLDADSGKVRFTTYVTDGDDKSGYGCSIWGSAAVDTEREWAYVGVGQAYSSPASKFSDSVIAIDYKSGELKWGHQFTKDDVWTLGNDKGEDFDVGASVVLYEVGGKELIGAGDKGGHFYALDRDKGERIWTRELTPGGRTGGVMASPAVADGVIYVVSNDGISENFGSGGPSAGSAFALDGKNGKVLWQVPIEPGAFGGVAVANGLMFFTTLDGVIHALDTEDGKELWKDELAGGAESAASGVSVADGMVYAGAGWAWVAGAPPAGAVTAFGLK